LVGYWLLLIIIYISYLGDTLTQGDTVF